jgi:ATP-binding cassette subfamily F protein 3
MDGVGKAFDGKQIFSGASLTIERGDKVAFVGRNGEGKSTLVKCIMKELEHEGSLQLGHNVQIGYFAQNQASLLDENLTVFDTIDYVAVGDIRTKIRDILGAFMFGGEASEKKVKVLSGGERSRLAMIKLLLEPVNLLILDEPTNHLDMRSKDVLKEAIQAFDGTVILVSHDRDFLDGLVTKVYEFGGGKVKTHLGGIEEYLRATADSQQSTVNSQQTVANGQSLAVDSASVVEKSEGRINYEMRKEVSKKIRKIERDIEGLERDIEKAEERIGEIEAKFAEGETGEALLKEYEQVKHTLDAKMYEWELLSEEVEKLKTEL